MPQYKDNEGKSHEISEEALARAVLYKLEIQKDQGKADWKKVVKMLKADGFKDIVKSEGFRQAVKHYQKKIGKMPRRQDFEQSSLTLKLGELSQTKREIQNERREFNRLKRELLDQSIYRRELENALREAISDSGYIYQQTLKSLKTSKILMMILLWLLACQTGTLDVSLRQVTISSILRSLQTW